MVAKIKTGRSLLGAINYNEHKVSSGKAKLIAAPGYLKDASGLAFSDKVNRLKDLTLRNERTQVNTLHVSLNFAAGENLDEFELERIAGDYMEGLGFGGQPYLVYQHHDAGHPHLHIVSTNIKPDGGRISFHLLANKASEPTRKAIEAKYGLAIAEEQKAEKKIIPPTLEPMEYGKAETKRAVSNLVNEVLRAYKFTGLGEFNAVLNGFNVAADRGAKDSRMYAKQGLLYWSLDANGAKVGVPIKASSIYGKPTVKLLEERFKLNELLRKPLKGQLLEQVDKAMAGQVSKAAFLLKLKQQNIAVVFRHNGEGRLYGVTFIDHRTKAVFNGSGLGKQYSANALSMLFGRTPEPEKASTELFKYQAKHDTHSHINLETSHNSFGSAVVDALFREEYQDLAAIGRLQQKRRKKKRLGHSL